MTDNSKKVRPDSVRYGMLQNPDQRLRTDLGQRSGCFAIAMSAATIIYLAH